MNKLSIADLALSGKRVFMRVVATGGVIGVGVALGAILASSDVQGWIIGLVVCGGSSMIRVRNFS